MQTTENQLGEIRAAGFDLQARRVVSETVSGSHTAMERPGFAKLVDRLKAGDVLVVTKLDRLGRNAMDVRRTVDHLAEQGIRVHCLALGGVDLTSAAGRMTMGVINAVAEFERDLLIERTHAGLKRAREEGKGQRLRIVSRICCAPARPEISADVRLTISMRPSVSTTIWRLRPATLFAPSNPCFALGAGAFTLSLLTTHAVGLASRACRSRSSISARL
ncbi:recombinase family protein [Fulvimarina endophytica]|uniref:Recombinase family protein n=1 Tax=Fulvimarina endophytica TaxID=2293836 RepID=A0A371X589_9HYPH|nr:recombinase family protein [Fulvimarina endophytica]RFC64396.1 recombinase family protein [Fulvimarina endophytica]